MKKQSAVAIVRAALLKGGLQPDSLGKNKAGNVVYRRGYFYRHGGSEHKLAAEITVALVNAGIRHVLVDQGDHWAAFRGGATTAQGSHWWVEIKVLPYTCAVCGHIVNEAVAFCSDACALKGMPAGIIDGK